MPNSRTLLGTLASFGSTATNKYVKSSVITLQGNNGSGWTTIPADQYYMRRRTGYIEQRATDDSDNEVDWSAYDPTTPGGSGTGWQVTYTVFNVGAETTYPNEVILFSLIEPYSVDFDSEIADTVVAEFIDASQGRIADWQIGIVDAQTISSDSGNVKLNSATPYFSMGAASAILTGKGIWQGKDSGAYKWRVGNPAGGYILWDDTTLSVNGSVSIAGTLTVSGATQSDDYSAGIKGWKISGGGNAEFRNIIWRGEAHGAVMVYGLIKATAGSEIIAKSAGTLKADVTTQTSPTTFNLDIKDPPTGHTQLFAASDILRLKDENGSDVWVTISSVSDQTTFWRYVCTKSNGANATFRIGTVVTDYGQSGQGFLYLTADGANAPYYSVQTHAGSPWSTTTERGRFGNMNGAFGVASNVYGFGVGDYAGGNYLKYETSGGFVLKAGGGAALINNSGFSVGVSTTVWGQQYSFNIQDAAFSLNMGSLYGINGTSNAIYVDSKRRTGKDSILYLQANAEAGQNGQVRLETLTADSVLYTLVVDSSGIALNGPIDTHIQIIGGKHFYPTVDSTGAIRVANAAGTDYVYFDTTNNRVGINGVPTSTFEVDTTQNNAGIQLTFTASSSASVSAALAMSVNDGAAMSSSDRLMQILGGGFDGTVIRTALTILGRATENWDSTHRGSKYEIYTIPNGSTTQTLAITIDQDQSLTVAGALKSSVAVALTGTTNNVGTITTGTWNGGVIGATYGGTGINNGSNNLTIPATGTAALLGTANVFTANQTLSGARLYLAKGANVASATTLTLGADGNYFNVTGTTTINTITVTGWTAGSIIVLTFAGALTLTNNSGGAGSIQTSTKANLSVAANDSVMLMFDGTMWLQLGTATNHSSL